MTVPGTAGVVIVADTGDGSLMRYAMALLGLLLAVGSAMAAEQAVLNGDSFWRFYVALRPPAVTGSQPAVLGAQVPYRAYPGIQHLETGPPPAPWRTPDFDDASWPRVRVAEKWADALAHVAFRPGIQFSNALLCLRGKFAASEPAGIQGLALSLKYRGGVVVYLNGQEIARQDLPAGEFRAETPGTAYPPEACVDSRGKPLPDPYHAEKRIQAGERDLADRLAGRERSLGPLAVPPSALRKGLNLLAIELHRSDYHPSALAWFREPNLECGWVPVGLDGVRLAATGTGVVPNTGRPKGFQVWNQDVNDRVTVLDYGDPNETLEPIALVGARNGAFSGQIVVGSTQPIAGLRAVASDLEADGGRRIPASRLRIRYPILDGHGYHWPDWFDGIQDSPRVEVPVHKDGGGAVQPVLDAIRERLAAQGMEQALCLGILSDGTAPREVFAAFDEIVPGGAKWTRGCHSSTREEAPYRADKGGGTVVCHEFCYGMAMADPSASLRAGPAKGLPAVWTQRNRPGVAFIRHNFDDTLSLLKYRTMAERSLYVGTRGIGRICLDFWDVVRDQQGRPDNIYNRWPHSSCAQRAPSLFRLACPGPDGPAPTVRFEQLREGVQDAEAVLVVAQAVGEHADALGPELAAECRRLLVERINYCRRTAPETYGRVHFRTCHGGWSDLVARLYEAAAEVSKKLNRRHSLPQVSSPAGG